MGVKAPGTEKRTTFLLAHSVGGEVSLKVGGGGEVESEGRGVQEADRWKRGRVVGGRIEVKLN